MTNDGNLVVSILKRQNEIIITVPRDTRDYNIFWPYTFTEANSVDTVVIINCVLSITAVKDINIITCNTNYFVITLTADKYVIATIAIKRVITSIAIKFVIALTANECIITATPVLPYSTLPADRCFPYRSNDAFCSQCRLLSTLYRRQT